ncbi:MAG: DoxX family protein [Saprospiraceae bacterium]
MNKKTRNILLWVSRIIMGVGFLLASVGKLLHAPSIIKMFNEWGFPDQFYFLIGIIEIIGAILLLIPKTSKYAALGLIGLMIGASITHMLNDPIVELIRPLIFLMFLGMIVYLSRRQTD